MKLIILVSLITSVYSLINYEIVVQEEWESWKLAHNKTYLTAQEEKFRIKVYMENKVKIARHNQRVYLSQGSTYYMKMNCLGDQLHHEVLSTRNGYRKGHLKSVESKLVVVSTFIAPENVKFPESVDWRSNGAVTKVKNQGACGSCWAFSATGALEGQNFRKTGKLVSLSEQNLIDCSEQFGNNGCQGGLMDFAFQYIKENHGIDTEESYPYEAEDDKCRFSPKNIGADDVGFVDIPQGDEAALMKAVASIGPVSIAIDASQESFQFYSTGVYQEHRCSSRELDHGVLIVGYGTENGQDYWLVKNSWGSGWGDNGYIKMARNKGNQCGVATSASFPLV